MKYMQLSSLLTVTILPLSFILLIMPSIQCTPHSSSLITGKGNRHKRLEPPQDDGHRRRHRKRSLPNEQSILDPERATTRVLGNMENLSSPNLGEEARSRSAPQSVVADRDMNSEEITPGPAIVQNSDADPDLGNSSNNASEPFPNCSHCALKEERRLHRIEAVKAQILSKLRLKEPPNVTINMTKISRDIPLIRNFLDSEKMMSDAPYGPPYEEPDPYHARTNRIFKFAKNGKVFTVVKSHCTVKLAGK